MYENEIYSNSDTGNYTTYQTYGSAYQAGGSGNGGKGDGKKKMGAFRKILLSMTLGLVFGLFAGAGFYVVKLGTDQIAQTENREQPDSGEGEAESLPASAQADVKQITYVNAAFSDVVEEVMPAMVSIINNFTSRGKTFWGQDYSEQGQSSGSGIIVAEDEATLLIVTNNHVVDGAESLEIIFIDGSTAEAKIRGIDSDMDLAVVAVELEKLSEETRNAISVATLGDSDSLRMGDPVIAIGNALGIGLSVTDGIISALDREMTTEDGNTGIFIQTNAAINRGNSGGALLNINGEVIGINSNKLGGDLIEGMGYAIPISAASPIIADLMERRTEVVAQDEVGYMGVSMQNVSEEAVAWYGMPQGAFVYSVEEGSPAEQAGFEYGDIIVKFDGRRIASRSDVQDAIQYYKAGDTVKVTVKRVSDGEYASMDLEVTLGSRP